MTAYLIAVLTAELHRAGLYADRYGIASRLTGRRIADLNRLTEEEKHRMLRAVRLRALIP